jgi:hypothetical protein
MSEQKTSEAASVAPTEGNLKRSIQMSFFATKSDHLKVGLAFTDDKSPTKGDAAKSSKVLGQIVGFIGAVDTREGTLPDGTPSTSMVGIGEFEAMNYETGEVVQSLAAYLPRYYLEVAKASLERTGVAGLEVAVELVLVPTGKGVPTAYEVRNLVQREIESPIERLKRKLQSSNRLRLPPPQPVTNLQSSGELIEGEAKDVTNQKAAPSPASAAKAEKKPLEGIA